MSDQRFAIKLKRRALQSELHSWLDTKLKIRTRQPEPRPRTRHYCHERAQHVFRFTRRRESATSDGDSTRRRGSSHAGQPMAIDTRSGAAEGAATRRAPWSPRRDEIHVGWPAAWHWALKRKLNEISNRQELPRIGPIKLLPPVPRVYARILTVNFVAGN